MHAIEYGLGMRIHEYSGTMAIEVLETGQKTSNAAKCAQIAVPPQMAEIQKDAFLSTNYNGVTGMLGIWQF